MTREAGKQLATDKFIRHLKKTLGRMLLRTKPGLKKINGVSGVQ
jgi:hypothetical protein